MLASLALKASSRSARIPSRSAGDERGSAGRPGPQEKAPPKRGQVCLRKEGSLVFRGSAIQRAGAGSLTANTCHQSVAVEQQVSVPNGDHRRNTGLWGQARLRGRAAPPIPGGGGMHRREPQQQSAEQQDQNRGQYELCRFHMSVARCSCERSVMREPRSLPLTTIANQ